MLGILFYIISLVFLMVALNYARQAQQAASYPPKWVLKQRAMVMAGGAGVTLLLGIMLSILH
ncbi:hypothetical protein CEF21_08025 [Bacillus sp. FJAT-42376]|uniref:hypothetical protein n=1 Tax=Bacillus sp. FJAT-42376 TaxID=2014076 RepID=UPI000F4E4F10|nr:hypothetical protein [Bacillus sp. FJAT-42376]AZB42240.1 hypothetical protein CEF21_08025 [Bacillus sp. FJAT-42376]